MSQNLVKGNTTEDTSSMVFGWWGVERTEHRGVFTEVVQDRWAATLLDMIRRHVRPGSIIHTDLWRAHSGLSNALNMQHSTVNHSLHFVSQDGVHISTIEGTWNGTALSSWCR